MKKGLSLSKQFSHGIFIISLDFELYWGVRDKRSLSNYGEHLQQTRTVVTNLLELFREHKIHATWSTVGFLFYPSREDLNKAAPSLRPGYVNPKLCPYKYLESNPHLDRAVHFAPDLIKLIGDSPGQEVGTHTFSHFYCLEQGVSKESFEADLASALKIGADLGLPPRSLVFPRNQWREDFLPLLPKYGINCFRGVESHPIYSAAADSEQGLARRALRLLDSYLNLTGHHCFDRTSTGNCPPYNLPASRFLRPYSRKLPWLDGLKRRRIINSMRKAAKEKKAFHLWWHPHNFGMHLQVNMDFLTTILKEYRRLSDRYGMRSVNMAEFANELDSKESIRAGTA